MQLCLIIRLRLGNVSIGISNLGENDAGLAQRTRQLAGEK